MRKIAIIERWGLKKVIIVAACALGVVVLIILAARGCGKTAQVVYRFEKAGRGEVIKTISVSGTLDVLDSYAVLSKINGVVTHVYTDFNQKVKKGQTLATIDSSEIDQQMMRVSAQYEKAKLDLEGARMEMETKKNLLKENLISQKDYDQALLNYKKIYTLMQQSQVEYNIALKNKSYTRITSPVSGTVISRSVDPMDLVKVNSEMFVIAEDLRKMFLNINIDESDIGKIRKGQKVTFTVSAFPEKVFEGKIHQVRFRPIKSGGIVMYDAIVTCDNKELLLKQGMTATTTVIIDQHPNVLRVPNESLIVSPIEIKPEPGRHYVWIEKSLSVNKLPMERCEVKTGLTGNTYTEIISSKCLKEGEKVLVSIGKKIEVKDTRFNK